MVSSFVKLPVCKFYRGDVDGVVRKHGVGVHASCSFKCAAVDVTLPNVSVVHLIDLDLFVVCYCPPSYTSEENEKLIQFISCFCSSRNVVLLGDFNLPALKWCSIVVLEGKMSTLDASYLNMFLLLGLKQWVWEEPFHPFGNVLDLVFTSDDDVGDVFLSCLLCLVVFTVPSSSSSYFPYSSSVPVLSSEEVRMA